MAKPEASDKRTIMLTESWSIKYDVSSSLWVIDGHRDMKLYSAGYSNRAVLSAKRMVVNKSAISTALSSRRGS